MTRDPRTPQRVPPERERDRPVPVDDTEPADVGPDEIEVLDRSGRPWALRPLPRDRHDYLGLGAIWWAVIWLIIVALIVWWIWAR